MPTLREDGAKKVLAGFTTIEEVLRVTQEDLVVEYLSSGGDWVEITDDHTARSIGRLGSDDRVAAWLGEHLPHGRM